MKTENGRIIFGQELTFDEKKHSYLWNGEKVPSVTTILQTVNKPVLVPWAVKMTAEYWLAAMKAGKTDLQAVYDESKKFHRQKASDAADIGTNVHKYAECFFKGLPLPELKTDEAKRSVEAFHKWVDQVKLKIRAIERRILSKEYGYAGTVDLIAEFDGVLGVGDYKTSSGIYPEMRFQTAAYQNAIEEEKNIKLGPRWIIRFDKKTGEFEGKDFSDFDSDFSGFKGALFLHKSLKAMTKDKSKQRGKNEEPQPGTKE